MKRCANAACQGLRVRLDTDTEVIAHLVHSNLQSGATLLTP